MAALNKVLLIGNLGADPEVKALPSGDKVAVVRMATTETYKNKNGDKVEDTEWHRVEFWGGLAGVVEQYLKKGDSVYVEGRIRTEKYTDAQGVEKYSTKIRASQMQMLGKPTKPEGYEGVVVDDHLPF
jgi:single-strand DNA-binding protein